MDRVPLASNAVASAGYDAERNELELEFTSGRIYRFFGVPQGVYEWLLRTPSKGAYVQRMINDRYAYRQIASEPEPAAPPADLVQQLLASLQSPATESVD